MKRSADVLVLAGERLAAQDVEPCVRQAGHRLLGMVGSVASAIDLLRDARTRAAARPVLALIDLDLARDAASAEAVASLVRTLDAPAVYVASQVQDLELQGPGGSGIPGPDDIACLLAPRELSLAMRLALRCQASEERRLRDIIEDQQAFICRFRPDGTITFASNDFCRFVDRRPDEIVGQDVVPLMPEEARRGFPQSLGVSPDKPVIELPDRALMIGGEHRWQRWTGRAILDDGGQIVEYQIVARDITTQKQAEQALRRSQARYVSIFQLSAMPMWELDVTGLLQELDALRSQGVTDFPAYFDAHPASIPYLSSRAQLVDVNDEALALFGAPGAETLERARDDVLGPESFASLRDIFSALANGERHFECETVRRSLGGELRTIILRVAFPSQQLPNMLMSCLDITERKRTEEQVKQLNEELKQRAAELQTANVELESFSYSVSHDLRAPLRAMDGFGQVLLEDHGAKLGDDGRRYLHRIRQASQRMARLIDEMLALSRMSRSAMRLETCDLSAMAGAVVDALRKAQPARDVEVVIAPGLQVHADRSLLGVVLENLLGNAWKFTSMQPRARIELGTTRRGGQAAYFVRDSGAGFDMAYVGKLFHAFQRLHRVDEFEGTGIGLATVKRIVQRHGGEVWAAGEPGAGATFTFTLG